MAQLTEMHAPPFLVTVNLTGFLQVAPWYLSERRLPHWAQLDDYSAHPAARVTDVADRVATRSAPGNLSLSAGNTVPRSSGLDLQPVFSFKLRGGLHYRIGPPLLPVRLRAGCDRRQCPAKPCPGGALAAGQLGCGRCVDAAHQPGDESCFRRAGPRREVVLLATTIDEALPGSPAASQPPVSAFIHPLMIPEVIAGPGHRLALKSCGQARLP